MQDKIRGSIIGGACGDALGYTIEFVGPYKEIESIYGEGGLRGYDLNYSWLGGCGSASEALVSDDTQMTLYTAEGLMEAVGSGQELIPVIRDAYLAWFGGQTGLKVNISYESELSAIAPLNQRRAPGNTCLSAMMDMLHGKSPENDSKGCGGIMRVAPIGLYGGTHGWTASEMARIAGDAAELTHLHPLSTYSSAALAVIIGLCVSRENIDEEMLKGIIHEAVKTVRSEYGEESRSMKKFIACVDDAVAFTNDPRPDWEIIENDLGGGWVAEETLAIALFSVLRHFGNLEECLICAVNHGGDSDSTGAVAGNIIGAIMGYSAIPRRFLDRLQFKDLMLRISDRLSS